jgi:hypothetical protein
LFAETDEIAVGLHLCFELALPRDTPAANVAEQVRLLHEKAAQLPFAEVTPLLRVSAADTLGDVNVFDCSLEDFFRLCTHIRLDQRVETTDNRIDHLPDAVGFAVHPGRGCEAATFGLAWVPPKGEDGNRLHGEPYIWHWHTACKTQYASVVSDEHLIHCHTTLVALLDEAITLGFEVTVRDETHYWETRDTNRLVAEVQEMNRVVARIAGALHDAMGDKARTEGAIFKHPRFEELESEPRKDR